MANIGVLIPNYNNAEYIEECVRSIKQAGVSFHGEPLSFCVFLGDDSSSDNSLEVMRSVKEKYEAQNFRIEIFPGLQNKGPNAVINRMIPFLRNNDCEYAVIIDPDDCLLPEYFNITLPTLRERAAQDPEIGFVYTDAQIISHDGKFMGRGRSREFNAASIVAQSYIPQPALLRSECLLGSCPINEELRIATTHIRNIQICRNGWEGYYIPEAGFAYRMHQKNISGIGAALQNGNTAEVDLSNYWVPAKPEIVAAMA
ncbi:MAG: glycosyltransferase family 2 protein [Alphaproteobacteria bacterium]|nr:glycosyltransferase family 2 protein [Alphaproteobacteria bacterium]